MMTIVKIIGALIVLGIAAILGLAAMRPDTFRVARSITINAPPEKIYPLIADLKGFNTWNPYTKKDPESKGEYSGLATGVGAKFAWEGEKVGTGSMTVAELVPSSKIVMDLAFLKPFEANNVATFSLTPKGTATDVIWEMTGPTPFFAKIIHTLVDVDRMVGGDFEDGLKSLKALAER